VIRCDSLRPVNQ